jgi:hypothetical protein
VPERGQTAHSLLETKSPPSTILLPSSTSQLQPPSLPASPLQARQSLLWRVDPVTVTQTRPTDRPNTYPHPTYKQIHHRSLPACSLLHLQQVHFCALCAPRQTRIASEPVTQVARPSLSFLPCPTRRSNFLGRLQSRGSSNTSSRVARKSSRFPLFVSNFHRARQTTTPPAARSLCFVPSPYTARQAPDISHRGLVYHFCPHKDRTIRPSVAMAFLARAALASRS